MSDHRRGPRRDRRGAQAEVEELAERTGALLATTLPARGMFDHPHFRRQKVTTPPEAFADYAGYVAERLSDRARHFFTLNECATFVELGHATGVFAPGLKLPPSVPARVPGP
jgi:Glycosyl hydrolase family 1